MQEPRRISTRKGKWVMSPYSDREAVTLLSKIDSKFAQSLTRDAKGNPLNLSDEQLAWAHVIVVEANKKEAEVKVETAVIGDISLLIEMFELSSKHLQKPRIRLQFADGTKIEVFRDKAVGFVVSVNKKLAGRIKISDQLFHPSANLGHKRAELVSILTGLCINPVRIAQLYGKATGRCCFCGLDLTDPRSVVVGYGPICAERWGFPWGGDKKELAETLNNEAKLKILLDQLHKEGAVDRVFPIGEIDAEEPE